MEKSGAVAGRPRRSGWRLTGAVKGGACAGVPAQGVHCCAAPGSHPRQAEKARCWQHSRHAPSPCCSRAASGSAAGKTSQLVILKYTCLAHGADIHDAYDARRSARHCHSMHRAHLSAGVSPSRCSAWSSTTSRWLRLRGCGSLPDVLMSGAAGEAPLMVRSSALALRPPRLCPGRQQAPAKRLNSQAQLGNGGGSPGPPQP